MRLKTGLKRNHKMEDKPNNRRKFLKDTLGLAGILGAGTVAGSCSPESSDTEKIKVLTPEGRIVEVNPEELSLAPTLKSYNERKGITGKKFVMVVDLARCSNARKCVSACNKKHLISTPNDWLKIYSMQDNEKSSPYWQPVMCQHCERPPCVKVCPVDATFKREDGIVLIDNDRCIGCRFCMAACPYSTRIFNWEDPIEEIELDSIMNEHVHSSDTSLPPQRGTVSKCDFCPDMIGQGKLPHCVSACPNSVYYFGDIYEDIVTNGSETVRLSKLLKDRAGYRMMEDLGTNPSVYYLPPSDRLYDYEDGLENYNEFKNDETEIES